LNSGKLAAAVPPTIMLRRVVEPKVLVLFIDVSCCLI
jgi:hypothetical protein